MYKNKRFTFISKINFGEEIAKIHPAILRETMRRQENIFTKGNLTLTNIILLDSLSEKGVLVMSEIAAILNLSMGAATGIVDKMIEQGLLKRERSEEDRRVVKVQLEKKGKEMADKVRVDLVNMTNDIYSVLTEAEKKEFIRILKKVFHSLG